ncbi:unnamed protein product [Prorocentrum cordatum]|uniref:Uncharacterized protein n=1 Tax=Prorocentrum cordatum TaxID=2364126 RepID=A0ABN9XRX8_9DINO|nr:unnamed protein product [Polarella glacialis]
MLHVYFSNIFAVVAVVGEACGEPIEYVNGDARRLLITLTGSSALSVSLTMPSAPGEAEEGYGWDPVCAWFNANTSEWTTEGAEIVGSVNESGGDVTCQASTGGSNMAYTGVWIELLLPTTTTTTTRTDYEHNLDDNHHVDHHELVGLRPSPAAEPVLARAVELLLGPGQTPAPRTRPAWSSRRTTRAWCSAQKAARTPRS